MVWEKYDIYLNFHVNKKKNNQFSIDSIVSHMGEITIKGAMGTKGKVPFQGMHMTCVILMLVYNLKLFISNTPFNTRF
jgi:hypothetical protein